MRGRSARVLLLDGSPWSGEERGGVVLRGFGPAHQSTCPNLSVPICVMGTRALALCTSERLQRLLG